LPATDAISPSLSIEWKVTGIIANELTSRFLTFQNVSGLLSKITSEYKDVCLYTTSPLLIALEAGHRFENNFRVS
jgi:hypothetical protein